MTVKFVAVHLTIMGVQVSFERPITGKHQWRHGNAQATTRTVVSGKAAKPEQGIIDETDS